MSRRSGKEIEKKKERSKRGGGEFRGFINHTLTAENKRDYATWMLTEDPLANHLPTILEEGYKVTLSIDKRTSAFMAALSTKDDGHLNANMVLTARAGGDPWEAASRALFLHYYVLEEVWPDPGVTGEYVDEWAED